MEEIEDSRGFLGVLFIVLSVAYVVLIYLKGTGGATYLDYAMLFGLSYYVFVPLKAAWRVEGDSDFWGVVGEGYSAMVLMVILAFIGAYLFFMLMAYFMNSTHNVLFQLVVIFFLIGSIALLYEKWTAITAQPLQVFSYGSFLDKIGLIISYIGMITFLTIYACNGNCSFFWMLVVTLFYITITTPAFVVLLSRFFSSASEYASKHVNAEAITFGFALYLTVPLTLPTIHIAIDFPIELLHILSLIFSIPTAYLLLYTINTIYIRTKGNNVIATLSTLAIFYGVIFVQNSFNA